MTLPPVVTVDGPSGTGKGTLCSALAHELNWHLLDSGALYRALAVAARASAISLENESELAEHAAQMQLEFVAQIGQPVRVLLDSRDITEDLRTEDCARGASTVAALPLVREALLERQRAFRRPPGLVADGRDMGTVVFPDAGLKIFLQASADARALRRYKQLKQKGFDVNLARLSRDIAQRDERDRSRAASPLRPAPDAVVLDTTDLSIQAVIETARGLIGERGLKDN